MKYLRNFNAVLAITSLMMGVSLAASAHALAQDQLVRVNFIELKNFKSAEKEKIYKAADILEKVINSEEFKNRILNYTYNGKKQFASTDVSNEQVYQTIMAARETLTQIADSVMDLQITLYNAGFTGRNVVGYTYPNTMEIHVNRSFFTKFRPSQVAGNLVHEWTHKLGFGHDFKSTARRPYSVPYAVGYMLIEIADAMEKQGRL